MITYQEYTIDGKNFVFVCSNDHKKIQRDDGKKLYEDLTEPGSHSYTETDEDIFATDDYEQAMRILLGVEV